MKGKAMRTVIVKYDVYKFDELSDNAKQKVEDWYLSSYNMVYMFEEDVENHMEHVFGANHGLALQFSLSHSQGDGVNLYGIFNPQIVFNAIDNAPELFAEYKNKLTDNQKAILLEYANEYGNITIPYNNHYCYCRAGDCEWDNADYYYNTEMNDNDKLAHDFLSVVSGVFETLCKHYEDWGYDFFYKISDDDMNYICEANEWEFYEDGKLF